MRSRPIYGSLLLFALTALAVVLAGCGGGGSGSSSSAPSVTLTATPATVVAGEAVTLSWSATNSATLTSSSFGASTGSNSLTLIPTATTTYAVTMQSTGGSATATATVTVTTPIPPSIVSGFLLPTFAPEMSVPVVLTVTPAAASTNYLVEDKLPSGWSATSIDNSGSWDTVNGEVKWIFQDNQPRVLHYTASPPAQVTGIQIFSGEAVFGNASAPPYYTTTAPIIGNRQLN